MTRIASIKISLNMVVFVKNMRTQTQKDYYAAMEITKAENESIAETETAVIEKGQKKRSAQVRARDIISHVSTQCDGNKSV